MLVGFNESDLGNVLELLRRAWTGSEWKKTYLTSVLVKKCLRVGLPTYVPSSGM